MSPACAGSSSCSDRNRPALPQHLHLQCYYTTGHAKRKKQCNASFLPGHTSCSRQLLHHQLWSASCLCLCTAGVLEGWSSAEMSETTSTSASYRLHEACFCCQAVCPSSSVQKQWRPASSPHLPPSSAQRAASAKPWQLAADQLSSPAVPSSPWPRCACSCCLGAVPACLVPSHGALHCSNFVYERQRSTKTCQPFSIPGRCWRAVLVGCAVQHLMHAPLTTCNLPAFDFALQSADQGAIMIAYVKCH